jgi:hypothetical protein
VTIQTVFVRDLRPEFLGEVKLVAETILVTSVAFMEALRALLIPTAN